MTEFIFWWKKVLTPLYNKHLIQKELRGYRVKCEKYALSAPNGLKQLPRVPDGFNDQAKVHTPPLGIWLLCWVNFIELFDLLWGLRLKDRSQCWLPSTGWEVWPLQRWSLAVCWRFLCLVGNPSCLFSNIKPWVYRNPMAMLKYYSTPSHGRENKVKLGFILTKQNNIGLESYEDKGEEMWEQSCGRDSLDSLCSYNPCIFGFTEGQTKMNQYVSTLF